MKWFSAPAGALLAIALMMISYAAVAAEEARPGVTEHETEAGDGRTIAFSDYGPEDGVPVLWNHGGPGSRLEPQLAAKAARAAGLRLIGIDRPGYGGSTPLPGRSIGGWAADALAVADALELKEFMVVGVSTGGAYAVATAAAAPERVIGLVTACAMTDQQWAADHASMPGNAPIWGQKDRAGAIAIAREEFGDDGGKMDEMMESEDLAAALSPADLAVLMDPEVVAVLASKVPFAQGVQGYADDRIADAPRHGWSSFDVSKVACPTIVIHGEADWIVPVAQSHHTAEIIKNAELRTFPDHGHLSVMTEIVPALIDLVRRIESE